MNQQIYSRLNDVQGAYLRNMIAKAAIQSGDLARLEQLKQ